MSGPLKDSDRNAMVTEGRDGALLRVRVRPRSRRKGVLGVIGAELSVGVGAPPEKGRANAETVDAVALWLGVPASRVRITSGATSRSKLVAIAGIDASGLWRIVGERLAEHPR